MSAAKSLTGQKLIGERDGTEWTVEKQIQFAEGHSAGHFSVGYEVKGSDGRQAFLKATDLRMLAAGDGGFLANLKRKVDAHTFERQVLDHCRGSNMDRIIIALDYGSVEQVHEGTPYTVLFLVFELASGDLRKHVDSERSFSLLSSLHALHNLSVAVRQLHTGRISHNDIKPGNFLVFDDTLQKLADLGRATTPLFTSEQDQYRCAGDPQYAPPEQLYSADGETYGLDPFQVRLVGDLYSLGSIAHYLLCKRMVTPEVLQRLRPEHLPGDFIDGGWTGSYKDLLPYWRQAYAGVLGELKNEIDAAEQHADVLKELFQVVEELCDPDPSTRGHPKARGAGRLTVERYISLFDRLRKKVAVRR